MSGTLREDHDAEQTVVGDLLMFPSRLESVHDWLLPEDFSQPYLGIIYGVILDLYAEGHRRDFTAVLAALKERNLFALVGEDRFRALLGATSSSTAASARMVVNAASARSLQLGLSEALSQLAKGVGVDEAWDLVTQAQPDDRVLGEDPDDVVPISAYLGRAEVDRRPWVVPGLIRQGWRIIVVAAEGSGKSVLLQQIGMCAAVGIHPLLPNQTFEPSPVLMVELENPQERIDQVCAPIHSYLQTRGSAADESGAMLWHREGGINIRSRRGRAELRRRIEMVRPGLVCIGPLYKLYDKTSRESDEDAAKEVQVILDDLRVRYGFALILEHHAPHGTAGHRDMRPFGSSMWQRWPDFGFGLVPTAKRKGEGDAPKGSLTLTRFRGDRLKASWPDRFDRSSPLPWEGRWSEGMELGDPGSVEDGPF